MITITYPELGVNAMYEINEKMLRAAIRHSKPTGDYPFTVASKYIYTDHWGIDHKKFISIDVLKTKLVMSIVWHEGYTRKTQKITDFKRSQYASNGVMYADMANIIEAQ